VAFIWRFLKADGEKLSGGPAGKRAFSMSRYISSSSCGRETGVDVVIPLSADTDEAKKPGREFAVGAVV
jgi:hypothetical protein